MEIYLVSLLPPSVPKSPIESVFSKHAILDVELLSLGKNGEKPYTILSYLFEQLKNSGYLKGTRCLGLDELVYKKAFITVCYIMHMVRKML